MTLKVLEEMEQRRGLENQNRKTFLETHTKLQPEIKEAKKDYDFNVHRQLKATARKMAIWRQLRDSSGKVITDFLEDTVPTDNTLSKRT